MNTHSFRDRHRRTLMVHSLSGPRNTKKAVPEVEPRTAEEGGTHNATPSG